MCGEALILVVGSMYMYHRIYHCLDRTAELRKKGYVGRRLGPKQMTTDTAVRVTRMVVQEKGGMCLIFYICHRLTHIGSVSLQQIPYIDFPELHINKHERVEMPFRYVRGSNGQPIMPDVCDRFLLCQPNPPEANTKIGDD